jgi:hypothetical protein
MKACEMQYDHRITYARHLQPRSKSRFETHADEIISKSSLFANQGYMAAHLHVWMAPRRVVN